MALYICGAEDSEILADYVRSQKGLNSQRDIMVEEMKKNGLSSEFSDAPIEVPSFILQLYIHFLARILKIKFPEISQRMTSDRC